MTEERPRDRAVSSRSKETLVQTRGEGAKELAFADGPGDTTLAVFVDDRPEDMPVGAAVIAVSPYLAHNPHDTGLSVVVQAAGR